LGKPRDFKPIVPMELFSVAAAALRRLGDIRLDVTKRLSMLNVGQLGGKADLVVHRHSHFCD
jgi:hypothetical protein